MFHYKFAYLAALHFLSAQAVEFLFDLLNSVFDFAHGQWTLLTCLANANVKFLPVKSFSSLVTLNHHEVELLNPFISTEASLTLFTFTSAMDRVPNVSRVFNARIITPTKWTFHASAPQGFHHCFIAIILPRTSIWGVNTDRKSTRLNSS